MRAGASWRAVSAALGSGARGLKGGLAVRAGSGSGGGG